MRYNPYKLTALALSAGLLIGCGPRAHIPPRPVSLPGALAERDSVARLARALAPLLYLQPDEWFPLERVVAVVHPTRRLIGYHLLWRDDVHGSWIPFTVPTDQEVVWVSYDRQGSPTDLWTFWHGVVLHADWRDRGPPAVNVQWGKHGSLPRGIVESDLPESQKLNAFYMLSWIGLPDIWLGNLTRRGPWCFCKGYGRYRDFSKLLTIGNRIDVVVQTQDPTPTLAAVFGKPFSKKKPWPQER
ncbi:MAG: hypothetical protein ABR499_21000 [Gemmatimonadaceae bacterium]